jgi:hypothetical protein
MKYAIDGIAIVGGLFVTAGVYLVAGAGPCLIVSGVLMMALAITAAKVNEE